MDVSLIDRPFGCPVDVEFDLPAPPSVNHIWRRAKAGKNAVYCSLEYKRWKRACDDLIASCAQMRGVRPLHGPFEAHLILNERRSRIDIDNAAKAPIDYVKNMGVIIDDSPLYLRRLLIEFGDAPHGCRLILRPREPN